MASPLLEASPEPPSLQVQRLESGPAESESVVMVKLTDEIYAALLNAQKKGLKLRMHIDKKGGHWDLGDCGVFHFQTQPQTSETDTICCDTRRGVQRISGAFNTKYQIQATDKSFDQTREKAQKLAEEEKSRGAKDATKLTKGKSVNGSGFPRMGPSATTSRNASPLLTRPNAASETLSKISPNKFSNSTGTNGSSSSANNGSSRPAAHPLAGELRRKKLRTRVIHLIVTGKFSSTDEVIGQLRKEGVSSNEEADLPKRVEQFMHEVAEKNSRGRYTLKNSVYSEVDARWPWFTQEEKSAVRKLLGSAMQSVTSASFAPMRKSGMERMQAPSQSSTASQNVSPESIPTPPTSRPSSVAKKVPSPPMNTRVSPTPALTPVHETIPDDVQAGVKRKAHVPSVNGNGISSDKRARQDSASPPEDPTNRTPTAIQKEKLAAARAGGSTSSSRLSSPCSLSSPKQPTACDYEKMFPECKNLRDAEKYFSLFHSDYPVYDECYRILSSAAKEFSDMEHQLRNTNRHSSQFQKIERAIQERFAHYEKDDAFLKARQRHTDLRAKLGVLKQRLSDWDRAQVAS